MEGLFVERKNLENSFYNKNVLIIGGSGGIGQGIAKVLADEGYCIYATYNTQIPNSEFVKVWIKCNMLDEDFDLKSINVPIDFIVIASGIESPEMLSSASPSSLLEMMKITCLSPLNIIQKIINEQDSVKKIVFISSDAGIKYQSKTGLYAYAKSCLNNMVCILSNELIDRKITVNAIAPGWCNTNMAERVLMNKGMSIKDIETTKIDGAIIQPIEVGYACLQILKDSSIHINGQIIEISSPSINK